MLPCECPPRKCLVLSSGLPAPHVKNFYSSRIVLQCFCTNYHRYGVLHEVQQKNWNNTLDLHY